MPSTNPSPASAFAWDDAEELARYTRFGAAPEGACIAESSLTIDGMDCAACSLEIERRVLEVDGVERADVNPASGRAVVHWNPARTRASRIAAAIEAGGYRAYPTLSPEAEAARSKQRRTLLWRLFVAGFCMMQVMMYAVPVYVAAPGTMSDDIAMLLQWASWVLTVPVVLFSAAPFITGALRDLAARRIGMDVPVALGIVVTFVASTGAAFDPGGIFGRETWFDSLTMFVFFLLGTRYLEARARDAAAATLEDLARRMPETAERVLPDGTRATIPARRLRAGDVVCVRPGQPFPADGSVAEGSTAVDEAMLTGESLPVRRAVGDEVVAGSFNLVSPVLVRVRKSAADTRWAQIVAIMERAAVERPPIVRAIDRVASPFLWAVLLCALGAAIAWWFIDPARSVGVAVAVLIVTCPCALSLAAPSAMLASAAALAKRGVLVRRMAALETLAKAHLVVFDKTGTLTEDALVLSQVVPLSTLGRDQVLARAAALAQASLHPLSRALASARPDVEAMSDVAEVVGRGVQGLDAQGRVWKLGAAAFVSEGPLYRGEETSAWLSVDGEPVARFGFDERLRADAHAAIAALRAEGLRVALVSGDAPQAAERVGRMLGCDDIVGGASPEDKLAYVKRAQARGLVVAMVGDGVNDGPVVARADVSIAIGQRAPLVNAQADFTSLHARVADVVATRRLALRTMRIVRQNLAWSAVYNAACVPLAMVGLLPPWLAGLGMAASSIAVVLNAGRLARSSESARPVVARFEVVPA